MSCCCKRIGLDTESQRIELLRRANNLCHREFWSLGEAARWMGVSREELAGEVQRREAKQSRCKPAKADGVWDGNWGSSRGPAWAGGTHDGSARSDAGEEAGR